MSDPETITITLADGDGRPSREIPLRRPTHGELNLVELQNLVASVYELHGGLRRDAESPDADPVAYANRLALCGRTIERIVANVRRGLGKIAGAETLAWLDSGSVEERAQRGLDAASSLIVALANPARLPK